MTLHELLDCHYGVDGDDVLRRMLVGGADLNQPQGPRAETALHVATRRCRPSAVKVLLELGADTEAPTLGGKTSYAHAVRRGFADVAELLRHGGASTNMNHADQFAVAVCMGSLPQAKVILTAHPDVVRTGNPEEDRLLADMAGRNETDRVAFLIDAGADLQTPGLDSGTPLHQAAWFGQPENARLLIDAGASLDVFETTHGSSPIGWTAHGSRYSGGAAERQDRYVELAGMLLEAGCSLHYPGEPQSNAYFQRLLKDATPRVKAVLNNGAKL